MLTGIAPIGRWTAHTDTPDFSGAGIKRAVEAIRHPIHIVREARQGRIGVTRGGEIDPHRGVGPDDCAWLATLPALYPEWLGDRSFCETHHTRFPYVAGAMANGIATADLVIAMAKAEMLGFFGAAGLLPDTIERALRKIRQELGDTQANWGANLIHSPNEPELEEAVADLFIRSGVRRVSASAYVGLTPALVRYASTGLHQDASGNIHRTHHVFAKVSRPEVANRFMQPAPDNMLQALVRTGQLTAEEASLARRVPVAEDITVEANSGGHTDNQTLTAVFPVVAQLRDAVMADHDYSRPIRLGAAGGLGTPSAVAAAFSLGAAYVLTGSINQSAIEAGLSEQGKRMLASAAMDDVMMAPAADMFEQGVKVQVLRRGTMFAQRAQKLYDTYIAVEGLDAIAPAHQQHLEKTVFGMPLQEVWQRTQAFFKKRDPNEIEKAAQDPKHQMALTFRWYLGLSSRWAIQGAPQRQLDYQIWCGPAMGAFNAWVRGSFLETPSARSAAQIGLNLMEGAAVLTRAQQLRNYGIEVPTQAFDYRPRPIRTDDL